MWPSSGAASEANAEVTPVEFGDDALPLRPTVTPPPFASQITAEAIPAVLPDQSSGSIGVTARALRPSPTPIDSLVQSPSRIVIPAIKLDAPIRTVGWHVIDGVSQWDVPDEFAAGWLMTSAPLGQPGNTAITGHHNIAGEVFRNLVKLKPGDQITLYAQDQPYYYQVESRRILPDKGQPESVRRANARWIQPTDDERITLVTCWPYTNNTHRLIIVAKPIEPEKSHKPIEP
jgi:sortase A